MQNLGFFSSPFCSLLQAEVTAAMVQAARMRPKRGPSRHGLGPSCQSRVFFVVIFTCICIRSGARRRTDRAQQRFLFWVSSAPVWVASVEPRALDQLWRCRSKKRNGFFGFKGNDSSRSSCVVHQRGAMQFAKCTIIDPIQMQHNAM